MLPTDEGLLARLRAIPARTGFYWEDLTGEHPPVHLGGHAFPAASVIKVPILLAAYERLEPSRRLLLREQDKVGGAGVLLEMHDGLEVTVEDLGRLMIVVSDNTASNLLVREVGMDGVNEWMRRHGMEHSHLGRFFMETPTPERDNRMSPADAGRCLREIWTLPDRRPLEILRRQQYREKIPLLLPETLTVAHKTGELEGVRHDAGIVEAERPYLLAIFTSEGGAPWEVDRAIAEVSRYCYEQSLSGG